MSVFNNIHVHLFLTAWESLTPARWRLQNLQDSFWRLYTHNGSGAAIEINGETFQLEKDRLYFIPAGVRFDTFAAKTVGQFYIHFDLVGLPPIALRELCCGLIAVPHDAALEYTIRSYAEEIAAGKTADLPMECGIKAVIFTALGRYLQSVPAAQMERYQQMTKNLQPILPAITYLENHYDERLSNEMLAELCCVTPEHFIRRFHRCTGMTPVKYLQEHRVRIAAQYLLFSERSIEDIATCTGFGNRAYFTRIFTRITGFSPAAYRRTLRT